MVETVSVAPLAMSPTHLAQSKKSLTSFDLCVSVRTPLELLLQCAAKLQVCPAKPCQQPGTTTVSYHEPPSGTETPAKCFATASPA